MFFFCTKQKVLDLGFRFGTGREGRGDRRERGGGQQRYQQGERGGGGGGARDNYRGREGRGRGADRPNLGPESFPELKA